MRSSAAVLGTVLSISAMLAARAPAATTRGNFLLRTTGDLVALCTAEPSDPMMAAALGFCHGFGVGVYRTLEKTQEGLPVSLFCPPRSMPTRTQAIANFVAWAKASPAVSAEAPADAILDYLQHTYPCARAGR